jgi:cytochrome P450
VWRSPVREVLQQKDRTHLVERIDVALHGLCQPLTVLQCRLAMGELIDEPDAMREAIREALQECVRMNQTVGMMRAMLQQVMSDTEDERIR